MLIFNTADYGGAAGVTVDTVNSGGQAGTAWDLVSIGGTSTVTYETTYAHSGSFSYRLASGISASSCYLLWNSFHQTNKIAYTRVYCLFPSAPPNTSRFIQIGNSSVQNIAGVGVSSNHFTIQDAAGTIILTSTLTIPTTQWVRLEFMAFSDAALGYAELKIYLTADSDIPNEVMTTTATQNTRGSDIATFLFGNVGAVAGSEYYFDDIAVLETGYVGRNPYINNLRQNSAEGQPNGTTLTRANSGGNSGTPFDDVSITGTPTVAYVNSQSAHGTTSYLCACSSGSEVITISYHDRIDTTSAAIRVYIYMISLPSAATEVVHIRTAAASLARLRISNVTGGLSVLDSAGTSYAFSTPLSVSTWYRLELQCIVGATTSTGTVSAQYYLGDSTTPIDSYTTTTANTGTANIAVGRIGKLNTGGTFVNFFDDIAFMTDSALPIGPASGDARSTGWFDTVLGAPAILTGSGLSTAANGSSASSMIVSKPTQIIDGDYLLVCLTHQLGGTITPPAGWTTLATSTAAGNVAVYYKYIPSVAAEVATNYTWSNSGSGRYVIDLVTVRGADPNTFTSAVGTWATGTSLQIIDNSVTTTTTNSTLVAFNVNYLSSTPVSTITAPAGFTQATQQNSPIIANSTSSQIAYKALPIPTATGTQTFTFSIATNSRAGIMFAIKSISNV